MIQKEIRELPKQEVIYNDDLFALDSEESNQTGKITYQQLLDKIREDVFAEVQKIVDDGGQSGEEQQDATITEMNTALLNICNKIYPVGSIYMSFEADDPSTLFGGTWERLADRFLFAAGAKDVGYTAGDETVKLSAAQSGLPAHSHGFTDPSISTTALTTASAGAHTHDMDGNIWSSGSGGTEYAYTKTNNRKLQKRTTGSAGAHTHTIAAHKHTASGGTVASATAKDATAYHNNMPPYIVVNMWKRIE